MRQPEEGRTISWQLSWLVGLVSRAGWAGLGWLGWAELAGLGRASQVSRSLKIGFIGFFKSLIGFLLGFIGFLVQSQHFAIFYLFSLFFQMETRNLKQNVRKSIGKPSKT